MRSVFTDEIYGTERPEPILPNEISSIFTESLQNLLYNHYDGKKAAVEASAKIDAFLAAQKKKQP